VGDTEGAFVGVLLGSGVGFNAMYVGALDGEYVGTPVTVGAGVGAPTAQEGTAEGKDDGMAVGSDVG